MKPILAALLVLASCACARRPISDDDDRRPTKTDFDDRFAAPADTDAAQRKAAQEIREIERRMQSGDIPKIQFDADKDELSPQSVSTLDLIAGLLLSDDHLKLLVAAHTDDVGTEEYNLELSRRRARSVKTYLVKKGVYPPSVRFYGYGSSKPIADNSTDEGRAKNRRVEFRIMTRAWKAVY